MKSLPRSTAKDVFSHLFAIVTLYVSVVSFIILGFQYIDVTFPDALSFYYTGALDAIRAGMASLIVMWPAFVGISWFMYKDAKADSEKREIAIRKWLLYLTLFVTAITIVVDLITLVNYFLNGEITTRFILKVLVVLATAVAVFAYYLWDLRTESIAKSTVPKKTAVAASVVVVAMIVLGFLLVGSPAQQRKVRFDDQRVSDLATIQNEVTNFYQLKKGVLPVTLNDLTNTLSGYSVPVDPSTGAAYEYSTGDGLNFTLCATFEADSVGDQTDVSMPYRAYGTDYYGSWKHGVGRVCFDRTIDPDLYPLVK
ncbi:MAG: DUF5671 domain-containing protein [Patescibacteria group bacterium]